MNKYNNIKFCIFKLGNLYTHRLIMHRFNMATSAIFVNLGYMDKHTEGRVFIQKMT
jgi:hypothetical protein